VVGIATVAVITAGALTVGELVARHMLENRITTALRPTVRGTAHVGLGATPALADLLKGSISTVTVTVPQMRTCAFGGVNLSASFADVTHTGRQVHTTGTQADMLIPSTAIATALASHNPQLGQATVRPDPATGTVTVSLQLGSFPVSVDERPALDDTTLRFTPADVLVNGTPAPAGLARNVASKASFTLQLPKLPIGLTPRSARVTPDGFEIVAAGGPTTFGPGVGLSAAPTCGVQ
jgi:hypothetical protein